MAERDPLLQSRESPGHRQAKKMALGPLQIADRAGTDPELPSCPCPSAAPASRCRSSAETQELSAHHHSPTAPSLKTLLVATFLLSLLLSGQMGEGCTGTLLSLRGCHSHSVVRWWPSASARAEVTSLRRRDCWLPRRSHHLDVMPTLRGPSPDHKGPMGFRILSWPCDRWLCAHRETRDTYLPTY